MSVSRLFAVAVALGLACSGAPPPDARRPPTWVDGRYARVDVAFAERGDAGLSHADAARLLEVVGQTARDWLEQRDRLAPDGTFVLAVDIDSTRLRWAATTWLFAWVAAPDHVAARVAVLRDGARLDEFPVRVESALSGYSWRDRGARLDRLARRLGQRVAQGL